ncbi:hypothetical protein ABZX72_34460 [Streptomyces cyaneofuscatus]|uniref:hypothetical protein n=1 Tax=Streptomyces cyaneofuscatus TaxID=66883 RepID=UPI0033B1E9F0
MAALAVTGALTAGYVLGRWRPWRQLGDWASGQVRSAGPWARGGYGRQAAVVLALVLTAPRTSWRILRTPTTTAQPPMPLRDPHWAANRARSTTDQEGTT